MLDHENNTYSSMEGSSRAAEDEDVVDVVATDVDEFGTQRTTSLLTSYSLTKQSATNPNVVFRRPVDLMY